MLIDLKFSFKTHNVAILKKAMGIFSESSNNKNNAWNSYMRLLLRATILEILLSSLAKERI